MCGCGGIGRRAWVRSMYPQGCEGSSPFIRTTTGLLEGVLKPTRPIHSERNGLPFGPLRSLGGSRFRQIRQQCGLPRG